ncbi:MAG: ATP-binding protein [Nitrospirae bacterium YQR-1]
MNISNLLAPYNPWRQDGNVDNAFKHLPQFKRPVFEDIFFALKNVPQIISITGPRRVGKSTLIRQTIKKLIAEGVHPQRLIYYSMDDPALLLTNTDHDKFFTALMEHSVSMDAPDTTYVFLDEIQRFPGWELFLKKYYDLDYPIRFCISGSATTPIFKKSRESLLGRIKDFHVLPFSFREFLLYHNLDLSVVLNNIYKTGKTIQGMLSEHFKYADLEEVHVPQIEEHLRDNISYYFEIFLKEGGFPEVWSLPDWETKQSYLFDNQVKKVILEDLVLTVELRKPEMLKRFYISLLENPGREINFQKLASDLGVSRATIETYFPLLEMTDLIRHIDRFSKSYISTRRGNIKCYLTDLALRNAVLRIGDTLLEDEATVGLYAENLVFNALKKWQGVVNIGYYRDKTREVDFIVSAGAGRYLPVEVKYKNNINAGQLKVIRTLCKQFDQNGIVVTKQWDDFGKRDCLFYIPLPHFLLLFD